MIKRTMLLAALAVPAFALATPATEQQWVAAATAAVAFGQQQGIPIQLRVEQGSGLPGHTPVGIQSANGACTLVVSARNNPTADRLSSMSDPDLLELFLESAAIHEVGHCYRRLAGFPHNERLVAPATWFGFARSWFTRRVRTEEAFADMTSVAWVARYHPQHFDRMVDQMARVRLRFLEPKHDTLMWLEAARREGARDPGGNLFMLAGHKLAQRD